MNIKTLSRSIAKTSMALAIGVFTMATASQAATYTVNGLDYDVTTIQGSFVDNETELLSQIWWGSSQLAEAFALVVGTDFGSLNGPLLSDIGPFFAYNSVDGTPNSAPFASSWVTGAFIGTADLDVGVEGSFYWAVATPLTTVPLPAGGLLLLSGLAGVAALMRRKKHTA